MKVCYRKKETVMDKVDTAIVKAKEANRVIDSIAMTNHEFQAFVKLLFKIEGMKPMTERIPTYVWYRGVKVIDTGNITDPIQDIDFKEDPVVKNWHKLYGGSNKMGSIPVDEDEAIHWGRSVLDPENEHRKNVLAREALDKVNTMDEEKMMQDGIQGFFHDLLSWTKEHPTSKVLEDIDEQMIYEGDEEPAEDPLDIEGAWLALEVEGVEPCIKHLNSFNKKQRIYMKRVCISCKKLYQPILEDDGDTCPGCARY